MLCDCVEKKIDGIGAKPGKGTVLNESNVKYSAHVFAKHPALIVHGLERCKSFEERSDGDDLDKDVGGHELRLQHNKKLIASVVCFECRRIFNDTYTDGAGGKSTVHSAGSKWKQHTAVAKCTSKERMKALYRFVLFESDSDALKGKLTKEQKEALEDTRPKRGRPAGKAAAESSAAKPSLLLPPPAKRGKAAAPAPVATAAVPPPPPAAPAPLLAPPPVGSDEVERLRAQVKALEKDKKELTTLNEFYKELIAENAEDAKEYKRKQTLMEILLQSSAELPEELREAQRSLGGSPLCRILKEAVKAATERIMEKGQRLLATCIDDGLLEDTTQNRKAIELGRYDYVEDE